jgi:hypothetical protein
MDEYLEREMNLNRPKGFRRLMHDGPKENITHGMLIFLSALCQKLVRADQIATPAPSCITIFNSTDAQRTFEASYCYTLVDCYFDNLETNEHGGAIRFINVLTTCSVINCQFLRCRSILPDGSGGCIIFQDGISIHVFGFHGFDCSSAWEPFGKFVISSTSSGSIELNESNAFGGQASKGNSFSSEFRSISPACQAIFHSINFSSNYAVQYGSGIEIKSYYSLSFDFCQFESNSPKNIIIIWYSSVGEIIIPCLQFINNDVSDDCCLTVYCNCIIQDCLFISNRFTRLIGTYDNRGPWNAVFLRCIFDTTDFSTTNDITLHTNSCVVGGSESLSIDPLYCPISATFPPAIPPTATGSALSDSSLTALVHVSSLAELSTVLLPGLSITALDSSHSEIASLDSDSVDLTFTALSIPLLFSRPSSDSTTASTPLPFSRTSSDATTASTPLLFSRTSSDATTESSDSESAPFSTSRSFTATHSFSAPPTGPRADIVPDSPALWTGIGVALGVLALIAIVVFAFLVWRKCHEGPGSEELELVAEPVTGDFYTYDFMTDIGAAHTPSESVDVPSYFHGFASQPDEGVAARKSEDSKP